MSNDQSQADWEETVFTVALLLTCVVFLVAAMTVTTHEESGLTSKSLPIILSVAISIFSAVKAISMLRSAHRHQVYLLRTDGITAKIILPLSMTMVLYVPMVMLFGYVLASVMVLMIVLRVFGVRDRVFHFCNIRCGGYRCRLCLRRHVGHVYADGMVDRNRSRAAVAIAKKSR